MRLPSAPESLPMSEIVLSAETTRVTGTRSSRRLRRGGRVPAVVYGLSQDPISIDVAWTDLRLALTTDAGVNAVIHLELSGEKQMSIVKDIQRHPVRRDVTHVDFLRIAGLARAIQIKVKYPHQCTVQYCLKDIGRRAVMTGNS